VTATALRFAPGVIDFARAATASRRRRLLTALGLFAILTCLWNLPIALHPGSEVLRGPADGTLSIRQNWAATVQGGSVFTATRDQLNGAPEGVPLLSATEWAQPMQVLFMLIAHYAIGWVAAWNVFVLLGFLLTGWVAFVLLDGLGFHPVVSFFAGYVLAFNPWMFERAEAGHAAFLHAWVYPLMFLLLLRMSRLRTVAAAALAGAAWGVAFLFAAYFGLLASVMIGAYFVYEIVRVRELVERLWTATLFCASAAACGVLLLPGLIAYTANHHVVATSIANATAEAQRLGADAGEYLLPDYRHPLFGPLTRSFSSSSNFSEGTLFFGWTTIVLAICGVILLVRRNAVAAGADRRRGLVFAAILVPVAFYASLKSVVHVFGVPIPALSWFITHVTSYFRVYARFGILVGLGLVVLAAPALQWLLVRRDRLRFVPFLALVLVAFELLPGPIVGWAATTPPVYDRWLAGQPRGIVAHYPMLTDQPAAIHLGEREIYWQMFAPQPLYNIFGAGTGDTRESAIRILSRYITDPRTPSILAAEHVRYVVLHDDVYRQEGVTPPPAPSQLHLIKRFPSVRIYRLDPGTAAVDVDQLLEQSAAEVAAVEGLKPPAVTFAGGGLPTVRGSAAFTLANSDVNLKRAMIYVRAASSSGTAHLQMVSPTGQTIGDWPIGRQPTDVSYGPFAVADGSTAMSLRVVGGGTVSIRSFTVQPLADYSDTLRAS
jgi:hypothetical protein